MLRLQLLVLFPMFWIMAQAKVFDRCDWAKLLKKNGMDQFQKISLADWVCLTHRESNYNTKATNRNCDKSTDYGIFQVNSKWWCKDDGPNRANGCNIKCSDLLADDPTGAINCAKIIARQQGITAWVAWKKHCQGKDLREYIAGCVL